MKKQIILFFSFILISNSVFCQNFGEFASGIKINNTIYNTTASAQVHQIDPTNGALFFNGANLGNFGEQTTCSNITGGELKTFKNASANVCSANLFWRVYLASSSPSGAFSAVPLTTISDCNLGALPPVFFDNLGPCSTKDQKWKDYSIAINFTQGLSVGNYILEIYFNYTGSSTSTSTCETTKFISNGGNNFKANFSIVKPVTAPSVSSTSLCEGDDLTLTPNITNGVAPFTYFWTGPNSYTSSDESPIISNITLAQAGSYSVTIIDSCGSTSVIQTTPNVTVIAKTTPLFTFGTSLSICNSDPVPILVNTSSNGYTGIWNSSSVDNTQNGVYNFISDSGQCANNTSFTVNVTQPTVSTFNAIPAFCKDTTAPTLPLTSNEGYTGNWFPALINNTQNQSYFFTPDAGQCASQGTINITVFNPNTTPTFALGTIINSCASTTQITLPVTSQNGIIGIWNPTILDYATTGTTFYTFTPDAGQCAINTTLTAIITSNTTPTFALGTAINSCASTTQITLPVTSQNGINGIWNPTILDYATIGTTVYNFIPDAGQCALSVTLTANITSNIIPTFALGTAINSCASTTQITLPITSQNGINGIWNPTILDYATIGTTDYTFTPDAGQCASSTTLRANITSNIVPTFISPAPICSGTTAPILPLTSNNGIIGTWVPDTVDNTQNGSYLFTPNSNQCASPTPLNVTVFQNCSYGSFASAVWLTNCAENNFFNTVGSGSSIIGPAQNIFPTTDFGTYLSNSGTFKLRGAEVKTFKNALANVCSARLNYRIYPQSGTPGAFTVLNLPFFDDCSGSTFPSGGPCNPRDQKWQKVLSDAEFPVDLTAFPAGDYILEVYYDITGDVNSTTQCDDTIFINNNGDNFIATYTLQESPTYTSVNPSSCNATDGSITIGSLAPNTAYTFTYTNNSVVVGPLTINTNSSGQYTLSGLTVGMYANFNYEVNGCTFASTDSITLTVQSTAVIASTNPLTCTGNTGTITISNLVPNQAYAVTYSDDTVVVGPTTFTADASGQIVLIGLNAGVYTNFNLTTTYCTATSTQIVTLVDPTLPVATVNSSSICTGQSTTITATPQVSGSYTYVWTVPAGFTNPGNVASFTATVDGTYTVVITSSTLCSSAPASGTVSLLPVVTLNLASANNNQTVCINTPITAITYTSVNATNVTVTGLPTGVNGVFDSGTNVFTISGTPTQSGTFAYTVSTTGGCNIVTLNGTLIVNPTVAATFTPITICRGDSVTLPLTSIESFTGTWSALTADNTQTGTYTFTPTAGQCATSGSLTITVNQPITSTFATFAAICNGDTAPILPLTSLEGFNGTWLPTIVSNTQSGTYTFTPTAGQCASNGTVSITVNQKTTPTFTAITALCTGETAPSLPSPSLEGITGTWTPAVIDNTASGTYTFVPTAGQCATSGSLAVTVQSAFDIELSGNCVGSNFILEVTAVGNTIDLNTANFVWFNSNGQAVGNNSNTFDVTQYLNSTEPIETLPIDFSVTVTNTAGCYKSEPITLARIFCGIQKGISVNNDGDNEFFDLTQLNVKHLSIFNRYGMKVYTKSGYTNQWKGQSDKGDELPDGTYYYVIDFNDNLPAKTGWIYINREN